MIAAIMGVKNEVDIIDLNIEHLFSQGVHRIYISDGCSTDGTAEQLTYMQHDHRIAMYVESTDDAGGFDQPKIMNRLAAKAGGQGADWILPVDADEFFFATGGLTIGEAIESVPANIGGLYCRMYAQVTRDERALVPKALPKVAFRWQDGAQLTWGNHEVLNVTGGRLWGVLDLCEWQYRSFDHFKTKVRDAYKTILASPNMPADVGVHNRTLGVMTDDELEREWLQMMSVETTYDPLPLR